jgi:hypothetical protein
MTLSVKRSNSWDNIASADVGVKISDTWRTVVKAGVKINNTWRQFYVGSDPVTYVFYANSGGGSYGTRAARGLSWKTTSSGVSGSGTEALPMVSRYETAGSVYPWFSLIHFNGTAVGTSLTLTQAMAIRPVIKNVWFQAQRYNANHGYPNGYGQIYLGTYNGYTSDSSPHPGNCSFSSYKEISWSGNQILSGTTISYSDTYFTLAEFIQDPSTNSGYGYDLGSNSHAQALVNHVKGGKAMAMAATREVGNVSRSSNTLDPGFAGLQNNGSQLSAASGGVESQNYWAFQPAGASAFGVNTGPALVVKLDYT